MPHFLKSLSILLKSYPTDLYNVVSWMLLKKSHQKIPIKNCEMYLKL